MKKINLSDRFGLTEKFVEGRIRVVLDMAVDAEGKESVKEDGRYWEFSDGERVHCRFAEGDSVAVLMNYRDAGMDASVFGETDGWRKKMCVNAKYMPYRMVVEGVRCVRAKDLTEDDALNCGVRKNGAGMYHVGGDCGGMETDWRRMLSRMFDRMFKVPYEMNPWVMVYDVTPVGVLRKGEDVQDA